MNPCEWLESLPSPKEWKLERMRSLVDAGGLDLTRLNAVHVAGSNGKGSVCAMIERVARCQNRKTGLYTSPHLVRVNERIRVNGEEISDSRLGELVEWAKPLQEETGASFFEVITLTAFKHFLNEGVELAVVEAGLGGRLDATNVLPNTLPVITSVSVEHSKKLGETLGEIAAEKAAIIKGNKAVLGCKGAALEQCFRKAREPVIVGEVEGVEVSWEGTRFRYGGREWKTRLVGVHQARNAAVAIGACRCLGLKDDEIACGLREVKWPGRFERIGEGVVLDGAHNPAAARALAETVRALGWEPVIVLAVLKDKDVSGVVDALRPVAKTFVCTQVTSQERCLPAIGLMEVVGEGVVVGDCVEAVKEAGGLGPVLATGSLFLVGELKKKL